MGKTQKTTMSTEEMSEKTEENTIRMILRRYSWDDPFGVHPGVRLLRELSEKRTRQEIKK